MAHVPESNFSQSYDCEMGSEFSDAINEEDTEQSQIFTNVTTQIENDLAAMKAINENVNKMREKVAHMEWQLLSKIGSSTWKDISELIGLSCATVIQECFKILDRENDDDER